MAVTIIRTIDGKTYWQGLSTDTKPTSGQPESRYYATDTDYVYEWNGNAWNKISTGGGAHVIAASIVALAGGQSVSVAISSTSAQSAATTTGFATVTPTVDCFFRQGASPTALSDGTDDFLIANNKYRINGITSGNKLAFKTTSATGTVYITPGG